MHKKIEMNDMYKLLDLINLSQNPIGIIEGRENVTDVTLEQLLQDFNSCTTGYCFLRVLNRLDLVQFLRKIRESDYVDIYKHRGIMLNTWLNIMSSLKLSSNYIIYRRAYLGENIGKTYIDNRLTNYVVPLWFYDRYEPKINRTFIEILTTMFENLTVEEPVVRILLIDNHMERFDFNERKYKKSNWQNRHYSFPIERYGK